jgi:hypothetical protein
MIFGLNLPNYSSLRHRDAVIATGNRAEQVGYASPWTSDHLLLPERSLSRTATSWSRSRRSAT